MTLCSNRRPEAAGGAASSGAAGYAAPSAAGGGCRGHCGADCPSAAASPALLGYYCVATYLVGEHSGPGAAGALRL
eukprot:15437776-Alexandrium_andersonii.AAC.1